MGNPEKRGRRLLGLGLGLLGTLAIGGSAAAQSARLGNLYNGSDKTLALTQNGVSSTPAPPGAAAPNPDPRNIEGHWWIVGTHKLFGSEPGMPPPLKPKYMKLLEDYIRTKNKGIPIADAQTQCFPHGTPRAMDSPYPIEIIHVPAAHGQPEHYVMLMETLHNIRRIYMTEKHNPNLGESFLGDSVGHWEGDTLVVDTIKLNDRTLIDDEGSRHSTQQHVIERIHKVDGGRRLQMDNTIEDPVTLERPYTMVPIMFNWRPDLRNQEYVCEENNRNKPVNGVTVAK